MMNKKAGTAMGDWISLFLLIIINMGILIFALKVVVPSLGIGQQLYITTETKDTNSWVFTVPYLNSEVGGKISDIIVMSYTNEDYSFLKEKTNEILEKVYNEEVGWELYLNGDKVIENKIDAKSKTKFEHSAILALPYDADHISFMLRVYEPYDPLNKISYWGGKVD